MLFVFEVAAGDAEAGAAEVEVEGAALELESGDETWGFDAALLRAAISAGLVVALSPGKFEGAGLADWDCC